jgi:hypothetical protein
VTFESLVPSERDLLNFAYLDLEDANRKKIKIDGLQCTRFLDTAFDIRRNFEMLPDES